jgi:hypothetical protein
MQFNKTTLHTEGVSRNSTYSLAQVDPVAKDRSVILKVTCLLSDPESMTQRQRSGLV